VPGSKSALFKPFRGRDAPDWTRCGTRKRA
jgi:hypothetical protein